MPLTPRSLPPVFVTRLEVKDQETKIKNAESPPSGDDFHNFTFCPLLFDFG
jgi:hypothetical protein